jgi:hypothetical protein
MTRADLEAAYEQGLRDALAYALDVARNRGCKPSHPVSNSTTDAADVLASTLKDPQAAAYVLGYATKGKP